MIGAISRKEFADGETLEVLLYDVLPTTPPPPPIERTPLICNYLTVNE